MLIVADAHRSIFSMGIAGLTGGRIKRSKADPYQEGDRDREPLICRTR
jgi:hypothetical protein